MITLIGALIGNYFMLHIYLDCPCGLMVRVPGHRSRVPGSIPEATRFSEK
jgi:hypothetical protein